MAAALALAVREQMNDRRELDMVLDEIDRLIEARQRAHVEALIHGEPGLSLGVRSLAQSGGLMTGIATEIVPALQVLRLEAASRAAGPAPFTAPRIIDAA